MNKFLLDNSNLCKPSAAPTLTNPVGYTATHVQVVMSHDFKRFPW